MAVKTNTFKEPEWDVSQPVNEDCTSLLSTGTTPFIVSGIIKRLLQFHFSDANNIMNPLLKLYIWTENELDSKVYIAVDYERDMDNIQQRPALLVKRLSATVHKIGNFRDEVIPHISKATGVLEGSTHQVHIRGEHVISCVGTTGAEAENLAEEVFYRMLHFMPIIRQDIRIGSFRVDGLSDTKEITEEARKAFYVLVRMSWSEAHRWSVRPESPVLKRIGLVFSDFKDEIITTGV